MQVHSVTQHHTARSVNVANIAIRISVIIKVSIFGVVWSLYIVLFYRE